MQFEVFTLLPEVFPPYLESSILLKARQRGLIDVHVHNIRDYTHDKHHVTDDTPYGGGGGMVMKPEPVFEAVESVLGMETLQAQPFDTAQDRLRSARTGEEMEVRGKLTPNAPLAPLVWFKSGGNADEISKTYTKELREKAQIVER